MHEKFITSAGKTELFVRDWPAAGDIERRGAVLIVHGLGEHSGRYAHVAEELAAKGFAARAFDQQGHGKERGKRGVISSGADVLDDVRSAFEDLAASAGSVPFLLGHSMGGAIALRAVADKIIRPRGLILSSPAVAAYLSLIDRIKLAVGRLIPDVAVANGLNPDHVSRDKAVVAEYLSDPLVHDRISPRLARFILECGRVGLEKAPGIDIPVLLLVAGDDRLVNPQGSRELAARLPSSSTTLHVFENLYHEVFNELADDRAIVLAELKKWLLDKAG